MGKVHKSLIDRVTQFIAQHRLIDPRARVLVAVSGGPDSVALLHVLLAWDRGCEADCEFHVAHLDHGIRGEASAEDARWVADLAERLGLPCHQQRVDVPARVAERGGSLETVARDERYRFLAETARRAGCVRVALGHHADDQVETVLARLLRGTGLRGLAGMPVRRTLPGGPPGCEIVRPFLTASRADIMQCLDRHDLTYRADATNADVAHQRNWVRHELLPMLERGAGGEVRDHLLGLVDQAQRVSRFMDACVHRLLEAPGARTGRDGWRVPREPCRDADAVVVGALVWQALGDLGGALGDLTYAKVAEWADVIRGPSAHGSADLPGGVRLVVEPDMVRFEPPGSRDGPRTPPFRYELRVPGAVCVPEAGVVLDARVSPCDADAFEAFLANKTPDTEAFDWAAVQGPLVVRRIAPGDRMDVLGLDGTKKVQDILVDAKVERERRSRIALVCDARGPLWLVGVRRTERARVTDGCRRLLVLKALGRDTSDLDPERVLPSSQKGTMR